MTAHVEAAERLHRYLVATHWTDTGLVGPDPGIRFNYRIGRFIKSQLRAVGWGDDLYYLQGQGYWTLANWHMFGRTGDEAYRTLALRCSSRMLAEQRDDGAWDYPNSEWRGRVATGEGIWGALGLLETYRRTGDAASLDGALRWYRYLLDAIGYQRLGDEVAVNYLAARGGVRVPNTSVDMVRFLAELSDATGDRAYLAESAGLFTFLERAQKPTGEFPYAIRGVGNEKPRPHFQCPQYNAFQCLGLLRYEELIGDGRARRIAVRVLDFLRTGQAEDGHAYYECGNRYREVTYHGAALGAAFARAGELGIGGYEEAASRAFRYVLGQQRADGGFEYSRRDYRLLSDRRSYPRYLAMILYHMLVRDQALRMGAGQAAAMAVVGPRPQRGAPVTPCAS